MCNSLQNYALKIFNDNFLIVCYFYTQTNMAAGFWQYCCHPRLSRKRNNVRSGGARAI